MLDVIILSNAHNDELKQTTKNTIETLLDSNVSGLTVIVMEQNLEMLWDYENVITYWISETFNYNKFANIGARLCVSPYICIANNDLLFTREWFNEILATNYPICSPHEPRDARQIGLLHNEIGYAVGRHLSGWCFVITRELFEEIEGFDEDFSFWCADNSLTEQLYKLNKPPMLVTNSIVYHLGSQTLRGIKNNTDMTIGQVKKYNKKFGRNLMNLGQN